MEIADSGSIGLVIECCKYTILTSNFFSEFSTHNCMSRISSKNRHSIIEQQWISGGFLSCLLLPVSWLLGLIQGVRRWAYRHRVLSSYRPSVPVIVVGNIFVGGTGKTPMVVELCRFLQTKGLKPGIISRGYGVTLENGPETAFGAAEASAIGDEPALLASEAPIGVFPKRRMAVQKLLERFPGTDVLVCDDGLQHLALQRDIEIIVQDARGIGNGRLLPAGPLRESARALKRVDFVVTNRNATQLTDAEARQSADALSGSALLADMYLRPAEMVHPASGETLTHEAWRERFQSNLQAQPADLCALAGIGNPQRFFDSLAALNIEPGHFLSFPDHHPYQADDISQIGQSLILMTEKDAVKCRQFNDPRVWFLRVRASIEPPAFYDELWQRLSSAHQTLQDP